MRESTLVPQKLLPPANDKSLINNAEIPKWVARIFSEGEEKIAYDQATD